MSTATIATTTRVRPIVEIGVGDERDAEGVVALWQLDANFDNTPDIGGFAVTRWQPTTGTGTNNATSHWVGDQPFFIDVSCHVREVSTFSGRERANENWEVGTATITVDNADGWADYPQTNNPNQLLTMRPGRQVRVGVQIDPPAGGIFYLWGGYIDGMAPGFDPVDGEVVTLECIDAKGEVGRPFLGEVAAGIGAGETVSARITRILDEVDWFKTRRSIQAASITLRPTLYDAKAVDLLNIAADSAGGAVFGDVNGQVAFRGRDWQAVSVSAPPAGTIGNFGEPGEVCAVSWEQSFNREDISTKVVLGRPDEVPFAVEDPAGFRLYGEETFERTDLETNLNSDLIQLRDRVLQVRNVDYMPRIAAVTLDAGADEKAVDVMAKASPFTPAFVRCRHRGVDGRTVFNGVMMVVGVEHNLTPETWQARVALDNAKPFQIGASDGRWSDGTAATGYWQPTEPATPTLPAFVTRWSQGV